MVSGARPTRVRTFSIVTPHCVLAHYLLCTWSCVETQVTHARAARGPPNKRQVRNSRITFKLKEICAFLA